MAWMASHDVHCEIISPNAGDCVEIVGLHTELADDQNICARCGFRPFESRCVCNPRELGTHRGDLDCTPMTGQCHDAASL
jgi:hypothetical protein